MGIGWEAVLFGIVFVGFIGPTLIGLLFTAWYALVVTVSLLGGALTRVFWRR